MLIVPLDSLQSTLDPQLAKAFDYATDLAKQLISLGTGILALTITFTRDVVKDAAAGRRGFLVASWLAYLLSIILGILTMMALTGGLAPAGQAPPARVLEIPAGARVLGGAQILVFLAAAVLMILYAWTALRRSPPVREE